MTPLQLYMVSPTVVDHIVDASTYGVEDDGPVPDIECPDNYIVVDPPVYTLSQAV